MKAFLLNNENRVLVEVNPVDPIWGIGLARDATAIENPTTQNGLNLLGIELMEVREMMD